jgi:hypothetical protein
MFGPQALDAVRYVVHEPDGPRVTVTASWFRYGDRDGRWGEILAPLEWMSIAPSGVRFASSVHAYARTGTIGLDLPAVAARISFSAVTEGFVRRVTRLGIVYVDLQQPGTSTARVWFVRSAGFDRSRTANAMDIPLASDGSTEVTDCEWKLLAPVLQGSVSPRRFRIDQRLLFDGVLSTLATRSTWREGRYPTGDWRNAAYCYRKWSRSGALAKALEILEHARRPCDARMH